MIVTESFLSIKIKFSGIIQIATFTIWADQDQGFAENIIFYVHMFLSMNVFR